MASTNEIVDGLLEDLGAGFDRYSAGDRLSRIYDKHGPDAAHHGKIARDYFEKSIALAGKAMNVTEQPPAGNETALAKQHSSKLSPRGEQLLKRSRSFKDAALIFKQAQSIENREHNERFPIDYEWDDKMSDYADAENMDEVFSRIVNKLFEEADPDDPNDVDPIGYDPDNDGADSEEYNFNNQWARVNNPGDRYHVTPVRNLGSIAHNGLQPNTEGRFGFNFDNHFARRNSVNRVFYSAQLKDAKEWVGTLGKDRGSYGKAEPATAVLKAKDPDPEQFQVDDMGNHSEQSSYEPMPTDKLDVWHAKTGWTPLGAHDPSRWGKVKPGHLRLDAKPKGQMQLFPKELYNEAVMNIVNELLSETTFMKAYNYGGLSKDQIRSMSAMRNEANNRFGQKIPVLSTDTGTEGVTPFGNFDKTSSAFAEYDVETRNNSNFDYEYERSDSSPTERLHAKLSGTTPHVQIDVGIVGRGSGYSRKPRSSDTAVEALGHELGHIIDPVQNDEDHVAKDRKGRRMFVFPGASNIDASPSRKKVMKSEGRAWRIGNDLQKTVGAFDQEKWTNIARSSLHSYTGPHVGPVDEAVNTIVNDLLDETTFLQARAAGDLSKPEIKAMSAMRKAASEQFGQKIPVLSTDTFGGFNDTSRAVTTANIANSKRYFSSADKLLALLHGLVPHSKTEDLAHKLKTATPNVGVDVGPEGSGHAVHILGHELGHVIDPVQNEPAHAESAMWGREQVMAQTLKGEKMAPTGGVQTVMKSEGRAWRVGKGLQTQAGALDTPESKDNWKQIAKSSLKSYTGNFVK